MQQTMSGSGISCVIYKSAPRSRQITTSAPNHSIFLQAGCPSCRPTNSVRALKATNSRVSRPKLLPLHYWQVACLPIILCHYVNYELPRRETARTPGRFSVYRLQPHSGLVVPTTDILRSTSRHVASLRAGLTLMIY